MGRLLHEVAAPRRRRGPRPGARPGSRPGSPRTLPAEVRRDDLMEAAAALFVAHGIEATTVDDIVDRARVSKGTFYHYFDTKNDVILALRERFTRTFGARVAEAIERCSPDDLIGRLHGWIAASVDTYLDDYQLHDVVFHDFTHAHRQPKEKDVVVDQLAALLAEGNRAGTWSVGDVRAASIVMFDGMHGLVDEAIASGQPDRARLRQTLSDLFLRMIGAAPTSQK